MIATPTPSSTGPSDLDGFKGLLDSFGVGYSDEEFYRTDIIRTVICCTQGDNKVGGFMGFFTRFDFDEDGKFLGMGAFE